MKNINEQGLTDNFESDEFKLFNDYELWSFLRQFAQYGSIEQEERKGKDSYELVKLGYYDGLNEFFDELDEDDITLKEDFSKISNFFTKEKVDSIVRVAKEKNFNTYIGYGFEFEGMYND